MNELLLEKNLTRLQILKTIEDKDVELKNINISVYRNHSFEHMENMINKFLLQSNLKASFVYSDYDDSFNFFKLSEKNDLNLIWIDFSRYKNIDINSWFLNRIKHLKLHSNKPILVYYTGIDELLIDDNNVIIANSNNIEAELRDLFYDKEKFEYSGTNLSSKASIRIAQELGLKYLPSFFLTPIKAIVVDMDNTFYKGVLGEDGFENIVPNIEFQKLLKILKNKGVLLSIASKNEQNDVKKMFEKRKDFILKWNDFSSYNISWESKEKAIYNTVRQFNIGIDSILFIDDNIGEINFVKNCYPQIKTLVADDNLAYKFNLYPLLERYSTSKEDILRKNDIDANQKREILSKTLDKESYFKSLEMELVYSMNNPQNFERAIQLLNKTNQFIFSYKRYDKDSITKNINILTISLKDKLSDSGIIGIIVAESKNNKLIIDETVISCRALGRNIENIMLNNAFIYLQKQLHTSNITEIEFKIGPRNNPAKNWLETYSGINIEQDCSLRIQDKNVITNDYIKEVYL